MEKLPVVARVQIADKSGLEEWLRSAYKTLLSREDTMTVDEAKAIGFKRAHLYLQAKEYVHRERLQTTREELEWTGPWGRSYSRTESSVEAVVKMYFEDNGVLV
jgi:hypothetical protein